MTGPCVIFFLHSARQMCKLEQKNRKEGKAMKVSSFFSKIRSFFFRSSFPKYEEEGVIVMEREEFAREAREEFRGNTTLLKAIEECMNRNVGEHERVSLTE